MKHHTTKTFLALLAVLSLSMSNSSMAQWSVNAGVGLRSTFSTSSSDAPVVGDDILTTALYAGASYHVDFFGTDGHFGITPGLYLWAGEDFGTVHSEIHNGMWYDYTPVSGGFQIPLLFTGSIFPREEMRLTLSLGPVFGFNGSCYSGERFDDNPIIKKMTTPEWDFALSGMLGLGMDYRHFRLQLCTAIESMVFNKDSSKTLFNITLGVGYIF